MKCAIFMAEGFETCEALITVDLLRRANVEIDMVSINDSLTVKSSHRIDVGVDKLYKDINPKDYDVLIFPGGKLGTSNLEAFTELTTVMKEHFEAGKLTCAICAAPSILGHLGVLKNKHYTCFPTFDGEYGGTYEMELAVTDGNLITGRGMGATVEFARNILMAITDDATLKAVQDGIQYEHTFKN